MFGLFRPRCPVRTSEKAWVEWRMHWLADQFGLDRMRRAPIVTPTADFFPDELAGDEAGARKCFDLMCGYMGVDPAAVTLRFVEADDMPGAAGLYEMRQRSNILVARPFLESPKRLLAVFAHELGHEILLKGGYLSEADTDHEMVTDLLPVFLGLGIFIANATVESMTENFRTYSTFSASRVGYLNSLVLGYALAVFAFARGEADASWIRYLRADAAETMRAGLRYLRKTKDCRLGPDMSCVTPRTEREFDLITELLDVSPAVRLMALWKFRDRHFESVELLDAVVARMADRDAAVRRQAIRMVGLFGQAAKPVVPRLLRLLAASDPDYRESAVTALQGIPLLAEEVVPQLAVLLTDAEHSVGVAAAEAIATFGHAASDTEAAILAAIQFAAVGDFHRISALVATLRAVSLDPKGSIRSYFASDGETRRIALSHIREQSGGATLSSSEGDNGQVACGILKFASVSDTEAASAPNPLVQPVSRAVS